MRGTGLLLAAGLLAGCSAYDTRYQFEPRPLESAAAAPQGEVLARALVTVVGLRRADEDAGLPAAMELRLQVENPGAAPLLLQAGEARLFAADLRPFPPPRAEPSGEIEIAPGGEAAVTLWFPLPEGTTPGDLDLEGLSLRWGVRRGAVVAAASASFTREERYWSDPYHSTYTIGFGYWYWGGWRCPDGRFHAHAPAGAAGGRRL